MESSNLRPRTVYILYGVITVLLTVNTIMTCTLSVQIRSDREALELLQCEVQELKRALEVEIQLRQELFPQLKKSAKLLQKYNPRLAYSTALAYAGKIYECSDDIVSMNILTALIVVESSADVRAVSRKGALGLTQVMPHIWKYNKEILIDPYRNIEIGSGILRHYIKRFGLPKSTASFHRRTICKPPELFF